MNTSSLLELLLTLTLVSSGAVGLAWLGTYFLRRKSAALRHLLWLLALGAPLLALPLSLAQWRIALPVLPAAPQPPAVVGRTMAPSSREVESPRLAAPVFVDQDSQVSAPSPSTVSTLPLHPVSTIASGPLPAKTATVSPRKFVPIAWTCGVLLIVGRILVGRQRVRRLMRDGCAPAPEELLHRMTQVQQRLGLRRLVRLLVTSLTKIPFCHGVFRPSVIFPESWRAWEEERVEVCLTHELAHVARRDLSAMLVGQLACIVCWFNPLVWFAARKLRDEAENAADDLVLATVRPEIYAANLVAIAESYRASDLSPTIALSMARPNRLRARIEAILDSTLRRKSLSRAMALMISVLTLGGLATSMVVRLIAAPAEATAEAPPARNLAKEFEALARETTYFDIHDALTNPADEPSTEKYDVFIRRFRAIHASKEELIPLLKRTDEPLGPKIRTLAIAALALLDDPTVLPHIADLLSDDALTFSRAGAIQQSESAPIPPLRNDVTVGENAQEVLFHFLAPAGYTGYQFLGRREEHQKSREEFDRYWSTHRDRPYCASWFGVRLSRAISVWPFDPRSQPKPPGRAEAERLLLADLAKVPEPDRTWIALWLHQQWPDVLYSSAQLLEMFRKLGSETIMGSLKQHRFSTDDPDFQRGNGLAIAEGARIILQNAGVLLRPQDADVLVTLSTGEDNSPLWFIAAAQLRPEKATEILRAAYAQFAQTHQRGERSQLAIALWKSGGEAQTGFLADKFYEDMLNFDVKTDSGWGRDFIEGIKGVENPSGKKLMAAILQDKRLDDWKIDRQTFLALATAVNSWAPKPVVSREEMAEATKGEGGKGGNPGPINLPLKRELLHRMRDSVAAWNAAPPQAAEWGQASAEGLQVRLQAEKREWKNDETPSLAVSLRNSGKQDITYLGCPDVECSVEVDGVWYTATSFDVSAITQRLRPGEDTTWSQAAQAISLNGHWATRGLGGGDHIKLSPGRYTIRVRVHPKESNTNAISNPVEIEVGAAAPSGKDNEPPIVSRIKILSGLDIDERRVPQDGRFRIRVSGKEVDLRVSVLPTVHGEKIVSLPPKTEASSDSAPSSPDKSNSEKATQPRDLAKEFEALASETTYFDIHDVLSNPTNGLSTEKYDVFIRRFRAIHATKEELIPLLKPTDQPLSPKIRTLAIAALALLDDPTVLPHIADLLPDDSLTFSRAGAIQQSTSAPIPPLRNDVTVGENAQEVLFQFLSLAGYTGYQFIGRREEHQKSREEFDRYWSTHRDRSYCASWFAVRLSRAISAWPFDPRSEPKPPARVEAERLLLADLAKVPEPDRTWIALWLHQQWPDVLHSSTQLLEMFRKLGPETLMGSLKQHRFSTDDPDVQRGNGPAIAEGARIILQNAGVLLRPQDADVLVTLSTGEDNSPLWFIAAAQLRPEKTTEILRAAYAQFAQAYQRDERTQLAIALWKSGGEAQTGFLTDKFYEDMLNFDIKTDSGWGRNFIEGIKGVEKPSGKKLMAAILQDKRLDDLKIDRQTFLAFANVVNSWAPKPVVSAEEMNEATKGEGGKGGNPGPLHLPLKRELLHKMRDSVPEWLAAAPPAAEWGKANAEGLQVRLRAVKREWKSDESPSLTLDVRNAGSQRPVSYFRVLQEDCRVEVDGKWYHWADFPDDSGKPKFPVFGLALGKLEFETVDLGKERFGVRTVNLSNKWAQLPREITSTTSAGDGWGSRIKLEAGGHTVRVAFTCYTPDKKLIEVISNPVEIKIVATTGAAFGPEVERATRDAIDVESSTRQQALDRGEDVAGELKGKDLAKELETLATQTSYFEIRDVLEDRPEGHTRGRRWW